MSVLTELASLVPAARIRDDGVPSASIALLDHPDGEVQTHVITSTGHENVETLYQACSISKSVTSLAIAKLVEEGHLSYETRVVDHVPEAIWTVMVDPRTKHLMDLVTVELLLSHRSGLSQGGFHGYQVPEEELPTVEEILAGAPASNTPRMRFLTAPGAQLTYCGGGFVLLQVLLEHIMGMPFRDMMNRIVLQPLGMTRSRFGDLPADETNFAKAYCTADHPGTYSYRGYSNFTELAAAGLWTTPTELLKVFVAVQKSLHTDNGFIKSDKAKEMIRRVYPNDPGLSMARGWGGDATFFAHSGGNWPGYICYAVAAHGLSGFNDDDGSSRSAPAPCGQMSLCVMTNSALGEMTMRRLVAAVFSLKGWPLFFELPCGYCKMTDFVPYPVQWGSERQRDDSWKTFLGQWSPQRKEHDYIEWERSGTVTIVEVGGRPFLAFDGVEKPMPLLPAAIPTRPAFGGAAELWFVVDGLEVALRMLQNGAQPSIEMIQKKVTTLERR